jgi:thiamine biosynthesis lipoprotein
MHRRDFLRPNHLAAVAGNAFGALGVLAAASPKSPPDEFTLIRAARRAMATQFEIALPFRTTDALILAELALDEVDRQEGLLTAYRETSEISRINRQASKDPIQIDASVFQLLALAGQLYRSTEGAFDITAGPLIKTWGFYRRCHRLPSARERAEARDRVGMCHVGLNPESRTVRFRKAGVEINLGSIGKGYALDRAAELLVSEGVKSALMHGGHSSIYALGAPPGDANGWRITVRHPWDPERRLAVLRLHDRGLATSAATFQSFETGGRRFGHIIDPRTGWPADGMASVTVVAPTAAEADALATAFFIQGPHWARRFCEANPDVSAVMLPNNTEQAVFLNLGPGDIEI